MSVKLSEDVVKLLKGPNFAHLATLMPDGSPQVSAVWVDTDGEHILVNTAEGRVKPRNVRQDPRVAVSITAQSDPYTWAQVRGRVIDIKAEGADEHIDSLAQKYLGQEKYPLRKEGEVRLILVIEPEQVSGQ